MEASEILRSSYLDLLFDRRNKAYGSYELRQRYARRTRNALIGVLGGALLLTAIPVLADHFRPARAAAPLPKADTVVVSVFEPPLEKQPEELPLPKSAAPPPAAPTVAAPQFAVVDKPVPQEALPEAPPDAVPGPTTADGLGDGPSIAPDGVPGGKGDGPISTGEGDAPGNAVKNDLPLVHIDRNASFRGDLYGWLAAHLRYPESEQSAGNEGRVLVQFIVELDGSLTEVRVARSSGFPALDAEAVRVVRLMPAWNPGFDKNKPVRSIFKQPVSFRLQ